VYRFCRSVGPSRTDSGLERVHDGRLHALVRLGMMSRDNVIISRRFAHAGTTHAVTQCRHYFVFFIILKCNLLIVYTRRAACVLSMRAQQQVPRSILKTLLTPTQVIRVGSLRRANVN